MTIRIDQVVLAVALSVLLSACGPDDQKKVAAGSTQQEASAVAAAEQENSDTAPVESWGVEPRVAPEGQKGMQELTDRGIVLKFPYEVNYDIIDQSPSGARRHRVLVELQGNAFPAAVQKVEASLGRAGYVKSSEKHDNGRINQVYTKVGAPTLVLLIQSLEIGPELKNADSIGSIHFMWEEG